MKKTLVIFLAIVLTLSLCSCGGGKVDPSDPNQGLWTAVTGEMMGLEMEVEEFFGQGFTIELQSDGKCALNVDGEKANGKWTLTGSSFTVEGGGLDAKGTLKDGVLTLEDVLGMGLTIHFTKNGSSMPSSSSEAASGSGITASSSPSEATGDAGYYVIESITVGSDKMDAAMLSALGMNYYLLLNEDGTTELHTDSVIVGTWVPGTLTLVESGEEVINPYTLDGDLLTVDLDGAPVVFKRSSDTPPASGGAVPTSGSGGGPGDAFSWWEGEWYGYWLVTSGAGDYLSWEGNRYDCYAVIEVDDTGAANMYLWDDDIALGTLELQIDMQAGSEMMGGAVYMGGSMFQNTIEDGHYTIEPDSLRDPENMIFIDDRHDDDKGWFRYEIRLRPWGTQWNDVATEDEKPPQHDIWYIGEGHYTNPSMMETLSQFDVYVHPDAVGYVAPNNGGNESGGDTGMEVGGTSGATGNDGTDAAFSKYSLDPASGSWQDMSGDRLPEADLLAKYQTISTTPQGSWTYDEAVAFVGAEPSGGRYTDVSRTFEWRASENEYHTIEISFREQGGRWLNYSFAKTNM